MVRRRTSIRVYKYTSIQAYKYTSIHLTDFDGAQTNGPHDVDLSSHLDVFYTVYNRVQDTPQVVFFSYIFAPFCSETFSQIIDTSWMFVNIFVNIFDPSPPQNIFDPSHLEYF